MGVTYTSTLDRQLVSPAVTARRLPLRQVLLPLTTMVAMLAIGLAYGGRTRLTAREFTPGSANLTNLNAIGSAHDLEAPLATVFENVADRRFAAAALFNHVAALRREGNLSNVGALATAVVSVGAIERTPGLVRYPERLAAARARAARAGASALTTLPVLRPDDVAALKPAFIVRTPEMFRARTFKFAALYLASFYLVILLWKVLRVRGDVPLLAAAHLLTAVGFAVVLARPDPLRDVILVARYAQGVLVGLGVMVLVSCLDFRKAAFLKFCYLPLIAALFLSVALMLFGDGPGQSTAKVNLGPVQPSEAIRLLLALFLAGYFARRWELLRQVSGTSVGRYQVPRWVHLPRADYVLPVLVGVAASLILFFLQKDLGPALLLSLGFLAMYAVATARTGMALTGCALLTAGFYLGHRLHISATLANRVSMWTSPWDNAVQGGDQIAQSIWGLATGGFFGTGLGVGDTRYIPAGHTDLALIAVGEELGAAGLLTIALVYALVTIKGLRAGMRASNDYGFFLSTAVTLFLIVPTLVMAAGMLGVIPLTGVVTPFLSYGGSAMVANFAALGILMSVQSHSTSSETSEPFRRPARYLGGALAVAAAGLVLLLLNIQVLRADDYVVKPHLSMQADGVRRFQYNQRVLDVARLIPRGSIFDRRGFPLATTNAAIVARSRDKFADLQLQDRGSCAEPIERCYPLGGATFHLLGDLTTRANWAASNTSYLERDADARLRGFDDHAANVPSTDASGRPVAILKRDYRALVPLLRHRHSPNHPDVKRLLTRNRDLHTTLDAGLQQRVASILASHAQRSGGARAAAVVLDSETGQVLAAASYPWPGADNDRGAVEQDGAALLDRARYGLYPPGSTFKLVTAAAALRKGDEWSRKTFMCSRLPDGRVGAQIPGWSRPVRDDVLDRHAHGTVDMHSGIVHSCNAYFAQLALGVGAGPILETASRLGISVSPSNSAQGLRATLPQAGYGQGDVVATPIRMARVAAAIAAGGVLRETQLDARAPAPAQPDLLLAPDEAARLARYMRDAVVSGSGRRLSDHAWRIAGKTGTGEVSGRRSHAWFVGFAPYGSPGRKIAVAVIIENAGYGGTAAAPVAGEIVTAAAAAGLIK